MLKTLVPAVLIVTAFCEPSHADLYYYTDVKGMIHITDNLTDVPEAQRPRGKPAEAMTGDTGHEQTMPSDAGTRANTDAEEGPIAVRPSRSEAVVNSPGSNGPANSPGSSKLPREFQEEFKDVIAASSIPPEAGTASCAEFKEGMKKDTDKVFQTIRELAEKKKKGTLGYTDKLKGVWMLKSFAWAIYRHETGPKQCVTEFDRENEALFKAETKEIEALTAELKDK